MRIEMHRSSRGGRARKVKAHRTTSAGAVRRTPLREEGRALDEMFSDSLEDRAEYERIIRDFVSVHDAVLAADEYDS